MSYIEFDSFEVDAADEWDEPDEQTDDDPYTITRTHGVGALQFSIATWVSGERPQATIRELRDMLIEFGVSFELGEATNVHESAERLLSVRADFLRAGDFVRAWYVSDGSNFAKVTYSCALEDRGPELLEATAIVQSLVFKPAAAPN